MAGSLKGWIMKKLTKMHTYSDIYQAAYGQKLSFAQFIVDWMEKHDIHDTFKEEVIIGSIWKAGWYFFEDELVEYFRSCPDYTLNDDLSVTVLES